MSPSDIHMLVSNGIGGINFVLLIWILKRIDKVEKWTSYTQGYLKALHEMSRRDHTVVSE